MSFHVFMCWDWNPCITKPQTKSPVAVNKHKLPPRTSPSIASLDHPGWIANRKKQQALLIHVTPTSRPAAKPGPSYTSFRTRVESYLQEDPVESPSRRA